MFSEEEVSVAGFILMMEILPLDGYGGSREAAMLEALPVLIRRVHRVGTCWQNIFRGTQASGLNNMSIAFKKHKPWLLWLLVKELIFNVSCI